MRLIAKGVSQAATAILCTTLLMLTVGGTAYITLEHLEWIRVPSASMVPIFLACAAFLLAWGIGQALMDEYDMLGVLDEVLKKSVHR